MLVAQPLPPNVHVGPISTGPAWALLGAGAVIVLTADVAAALSRRDPDAKRLTNWLFGLGMAMCAVGGFILLGEAFQDQQTSDGLHAAGRQIIDEALDSARSCDPTSPQPTFFYPSEPGRGASTYVPSPCSTSPRDVTLDSSVTTSDGVYEAQAADSFDTNGHVTVTDSDSGKQVCATVPDTADGTGSVVDGPCRD
ncbi:hypothetical protein [Streptomyces sp. HUAS TT20]|uniref:hypothetical protein n=1 Tax=Streptomyces sp. HUAS TT20 TaxID=3447509 RepID=UPI0021D8FB5C|nr:hypothetical protein [Streptomyces sp. HUAS 15-9]UXY29172.1 hypothetical protein N8I87_23200 [Streptomyces sp. HUAS 15-9]